MRRVLVLVALTGCQIVINHNQFEPASDATIEPDVAPDTGPSRGAVRTIAITPMIIGGASVGFTTELEPFLVSQDGRWIESISSTAPSAFALSLADVFASEPRCFCEAIGGDEIDCSLDAAPTRTVVRFGLWNRSNTPQQVQVLCIGEAKSGEAGELQWTGDGQALLAGARFDTQFQVSPANDQDGAPVSPWIGGNETIHDGFSPAIFRTPFLDVPTCDFSAIGRGGLTSRGFAVSTRRYLAPFISIRGIVETLGIEAICLGGVGPGSGVVSPSPAGAKLVTATLDIDGTVASQDGNWITTVSGEFLSFVPATFSGPPRCTCTLESPKYFEGDICSIHDSDPTSTQLRLRRYNIENGAPVPRRAHVACLRD